MADEKLDARFMIRVNSEKMNQYRESAATTYGKDSNDLLRECMDALVDGRLRITPTDEQLKTLKTREDLYDVN